jgi:hypothetical protein
LKYDNERPDPLLQEFLLRGGTKWRPANIFGRYARILGLLILTMRLALHHIIVLLAAIFLISCEEYWQRPSFLDVPVERSRLVDGISSYISISEARELLGILAAKWEVVEDSGREPTKDSRPPFRFYTALVRGYEFLGFKGDLKLTFFNDRLMTSVFYPDDFTGFVRSVSTSLLGLVEKKSAHVLPFTEVTLGIDHQKRDFISWEDVRLTKEMSIWIKRYS